METMDLSNLSARATVDKISRGELRVEECVSSFYDRINKVEDKIHAFITLDKDNALKRAKELDEKVKRGEDLGSLIGVCLALKDNLCTKGIQTTCASQILEGFIPPYNATVVEQLLREDAIILGKTNMDEFAMGSSTETSRFGPTRNPWDLSRVPGGSSGGSAAAVSSDESVAALGSDTGGSIRCPASFCSVVGLKPTYGLISRYGLIAYANSLEQIGPIAGDIYDCAMLLNAITGHDPKDTTSLECSKLDYTQFLVNDVSKLRIGVPEEFFNGAIDESILKNVWNLIHKLEDAGANYSEFSIPTLKYSLPAYYLIAMSEASSNLARYDGVRYGYSIKDDLKYWDTFFSENRRIAFGIEVKRRIMLGTYALSAGYYDEFYLKALKIRSILKNDFKKAFKEFDVMIGPTMPMLPFKIGEKIDDPLSLYMCDILTVPANLVGCPAISVPGGLDQNLPFGVQIISSFLREDLLLRVAYTLEQYTDCKNRTPKLYD